MKKFLALFILLVCVLALPALAHAEGVENAIPAMNTSLQSAANGKLAAESFTPEIAAEPFVPEGLERSFPDGHDDRIKVKNPSSYPFSAIAFMQVHARCGCTWECSGFMVGRRGLITAGHCLVCMDHNRTADRITFYFGYSSKKKYFTKYDGSTTYWYGIDATRSYDSTWDYGYVRLDKNIGDKTGWFGVSSKYDSDLNGYLYRVAGYRDGVLKYDRNRAYVYSDYEVYHYADTQPGYSGCPIYTDDYYVVAVNTSESAKRNYGRRFTNSLIDEMRQNGIFN